MKFGANQSDAVGQQELQGRIGQVPDEPVQVSLGRETGPGIKTQRVIGGWDERKTEQPYETGMLDQVTPQTFH